MQATICYVLKMSCERLEPDGVQTLLELLVRKLAPKLETTDKRGVQEMAVADLAANAVAVEEEFAPSITGVTILMQKLMQLKQDFFLSGEDHVSA